MKERSRRGIGQRIRRALRLAVLCALIVLGVIYYGPLSRFISGLFSGVDYHAVSQLLSREMKTAGELIAVRGTDQGILTGTIKAKLIGTVSEISVPYQYEIGLGVNLAEVEVTPNETSLTVAVPRAQVLYDSFQVTGSVAGSDFLGQATKQRYQNLQDQQHKKCREEYESNPEFMQQAWDATCQQLRDLFSQWTGKNLTLDFVFAEEKTAKAGYANPE